MSCVGRMTRKTSISPDSKAFIHEDTGLDSVKSSRAILFEIDKGIRWPHFAVIVLNLVLSVPVLLTILVFFFMTTNAALQTPPDTKTDFGIPGKFYCPNFIQWSLLIEFTAQLIYTVGSILLLIGAIKNHKVLCYVYVICGMLTFVIAAMIRGAQFFICEQHEYPNSPGRVRPVLPPLFKLIFVLLVCQLFWYWLVLSLVAAMMKWIQTEEIEEIVRRNSPPPELNKF